MKKLLVSMLVAIMIVALAVPSFAAGEGSVTITNAVEGQTYSVYQTATLDYYDTTNKLYTYTVLDAWKAFFEAYPDDFSISAENKLIVVEDADIDAAALAKAALEYAKSQNIAATASATAAAGDTTVVIDNLSLGYYLVDSSLGAFCGLTTTKPGAEVNEKNDVPTIDKFVEEDSLVNDGIDGNEWGKANDADLFQTINYKTIVTVKKGATNYVVHDKMEAGLTWNGAVTVTIGDAVVTAGADTYTLIAAPEDGCTFEVAFADSYVQSLADGTNIVITYSAYLNEDAEIADETNDNETWLKYGDNSETVHIITKTKVFKFNFVKTDAENAPLDGAEFKLYTALTGGDEIGLVKLSDGVYRVANDTDSLADIITTVSGKAEIIGLDGNTTYYLEETKAPDGYNKLTERKAVVIADANIDTVYSDADGAYNGIQIINKTGSILPETGGFGTTMFILIGGAIVLGAGVLLFAKKRMSQIAE